MGGGIPTCLKKAWFRNNLGLLFACFCLIFLGVYMSTPVTLRQSARQRTAGATKIDRHHWELIPVWEQLATDQLDPWQIVPRWVFAPSSSLLVSTAFIVVGRVGCLEVTGVMGAVPKGDNFCDFLLLPVMKTFPSGPCS